LELRAVDAKKRLQRITAIVAMGAALFLTVIWIITLAGILGDFLLV
jgi:hypothetical protein